MKNFYPLELSHEAFRTIKGTCSQYGASPREMGFIIGGGAAVPGYENRYMVWTPNESHDHWDNRLSDDGMYFIETNVDADRILAHIADTCSRPFVRRITYLKRRGSDRFDFVGVFQPEPSLLRIARMMIYRLIETNLPKLEIIP